MRVRLSVAAAVVSAVVVALAGPAVAGDGGGRRDEDRRISVTGDVVVARGELPTAP
jgi:hypothetical protein